MDAHYAVNVLKAIEVIGTTRVELLDGGTAEKLPGRSRVNRELVRQELAHAGSPDQWKRAKPVLEGLGLVQPHEFKCCIRRSDTSDHGHSISCHFSK